MNLKTYKNNKGIGLIEVIAALGISLIVITALVSLALFTLRSSLQSKLLLEATKVANREVESLRAYRDKSLTWTDFTTGISGCYSPNLCNMISVSTIGSGVGTVDSNGQTLTKSFTLVQETSTLIKVEVAVTWSVGGQNKSTHLYTYLSNWQNK